MSQLSFPLNSISCVLPSCCFPPTYWILHAMKNNSVADIHENYIKQTYRNRYEILGVNGRMILTVPVQGQKGIKTPAREILLAEGNWRKLHLTSIRSAYGRAAFFEHYFPDLQIIIGGNQTTLHELNFQILDWLILCEIPIKITVSTEHITNVDNDFRSSFDPSVKWPDLPFYPQVFSDRYPFVQHLSILDLLMNKGPNSLDYLNNILFSVAHSKLETK